MFKKTQPYIFLYIMNTENSILKTIYLKTKSLQKDLAFTCMHFSVFTFLFFIAISCQQKKMFAKVDNYVFSSKISFNKYLITKSNKKREAKSDKSISSLPYHSFINNLVVKSVLIINYGTKVKKYINIYYHSINYKNLYGKKSKAYAYILVYYNYYRQVISRAPPLFSAIIITYTKLIFHTNLAQASLSTNIFNKIYTQT